MLLMYTEQLSFVQVIISETALARCNKSAPQKFVNDLLTAAYSEQYMSEHSLGGTSSKLSTKMPLPPGDVLQIIGKIEFHFELRYFVKVDKLVVLKKILLLLIVVLSAMNVLVKSNYV